MHCALKILNKKLYTKLTLTLLVFKIFCKAYITACKLAGAQMIHRKLTSNHENDYTTTSHCKYWMNLSQEHHIFNKTVSVWTNPGLTARHLKFMARFNGFRVKQLYGEENTKLAANTPIKGITEVKKLLSHETVAKSRPPIKTPLRDVLGNFFQETRNMRSPR